MKKSPRKLTLNRETLVSLDRSQLPRVAGGDSVACTDTNCCSGLVSCATCARTCTSKYC